MKIVILEGIDGSGKTTLLNELRKKWVGEHPLFIDRFIHSNYVYEKLKGDLDLKALQDINISIQSSCDVITLFVVVDPVIAKKRLELKPGHEDYTVELLKKHHDLFIESFTVLKTLMFFVDGTQPVDIIVEMIMRELKLK